eukprot:CAMPEP_0174866886 /NCGR_PEP_ID=MMETSP1114-20130205/62929_1 /TAXON_ID=312471 /ORGANISM="Neobodo designis, Strain CCAP 1951/1" /LENGTH=95 /DNA_ID=CAMNT_0016102053 /DNA_START=150 /DNA_END=434 /DNA_ORIENTATION=+
MTTQTYKKEDEGPGAGAMGFPYNPREDMLCRSVDSHSRGELQTPTANAGVPVAVAVAVAAADDEDDAPETTNNYDINPITLTFRDGATEAKYVEF